MYTFDPEDLEQREIYRLLTGSIIPRPVAFVTTVSTENGVINAAPFSYFNIACSDPPIISLSIARQNGKMKDSARNALSNGELVVHVSDEGLIKEINETAATLPANESELDLTALKTVNSVKISVPSVPTAKIRFECKIEHHHTIKNDDGETVQDLLLARIVYFHFSEDVYDETKGYILADNLRPVARLAGNQYASIGEIYSLKRPN